MYPYKWQVTLLVSCGIFITGIHLILPKFMQYFTDNILPNEQMHTFWLMIGMIVLAVIILIGLYMAQNVLERIVQEKSSRDLQLTIYEQLRNLGFAYFEKHPIGESLALMNSEVSALQQFYRRLFPWMLNSFIFSLLALIFMMNISFQLSIIVLLSFVLYYIFGPSIEKKASLYSKQLSEDRVAFNQKIYESISSINDIRVNGAQEWDRQQFTNKMQIFNKMMVKTYFYAYFRGSNRRLSYHVGGIAIIVYGIHLVHIGTLTTGAFIAFLLYFFQSMHILTSLITAITEQRVLLHQAEKLYVFLKEPIMVKEKKDAIHVEKLTGALQLQNISFAYDKSEAILKDFNLMIKPGEKVAIVGESGSGKSTIFKLIGRFYDPQAGRILLDGHSIDDLSFDSFRQHLGFVFQDTYLFGTTIKDNILFGKPDATDGEVIQAAKAAYAHSFISELPNGYETVVGERGVKLSGGQKQRIAFARMFIKSPAVLILDEATSALDNVSEREVQIALNKLMVGRTTITIAHRLTTIMDYDKIVLLEDGRIIESGTYEEMMNEKSHFYDLATRQESVVL